MWPRGIPGRGGVDSRGGREVPRGLANPSRVPLGSRNVPRTFPGLSWKFPMVPRLRAKTAPSMLLRAAPRSRSPAPVSPPLDSPARAPRTTGREGPWRCGREAQAPLARESSEETLSKTGVRSRSRVVGLQARPSDGLCVKSRKFLRTVSIGRDRVYRLSPIANRIGRGSIKRSPEVFLVIRNFHDHGENTAEISIVIFRL